MLVICCLVNVCNAAKVEKDECFTIAILSRGSIGMRKNTVVLTNTDVLSKSYANYMCIHTDMRVRARSK